MGEMYRAELLAPAGSLSVCKAAVFAGADAVYMGGQKYSARAFAKSSVSEEDELLLAIEFCHLYGVKLFMTVNTLFKERELEKLLEYMDPYVEAGVDAVIVQDLGVAKVLKEAYSDLPLHASTQMTANTREAVSLLSSFGMERIVLSRELSLKDISDIYESTGAELEVFVHGAMCYSYSGACFMSSLLGGRSGNRGRCAGTCRLPYTTGGKKGNFLSMKDMNTLDSLEDILKAGAYSLKIEGRMKSELYTATVVSVYRKYLDLALRGESYTVSEQDKQLLKAVYDRGGETSYLYQHNAKDMIALADRPFRKEEEELTAFIRKSMEERERKLPLSMELKVESGAVLELSLEQEDIRISVFGEQPVEKAKQRATAREEMEKQLLKLGNSCFYPKALRIKGEEEVFIPLSTLNALRREGCERVREAILAKFRRNPRNRKCNGIR
ncbi:hypothetical protein HMPREF9625_00486 [Oribacterium parvum ACB1]|uniref:Peptidase U32 collagenase domain-containing protein n=1 Tax=Oribacterium parvum ACB1 TaxID=796943 RepID=G9WMA3_9FIRM|nr:U32 family peptidase [Oribacterium parvum]EHL12449.1 hypothetical protein HMPREF9625_00486 [Oribacterium parvum ACB1]EJF12597.1 peptidase, U32 family [Oribacterium parvum ACB8]